MIFVESWAPDYGSPLRLNDENDGVGSASLIAEEGFGFITPSAANDSSLPLAFVDGVRRCEATLAHWNGTSTVHGIAGAYAAGSVLAPAATTPTYGREIIERLLIWSGGHTATLPQSAGWRWSLSSTPERDPQAAERRLQELMRLAESELAATLANDGYLVVTDGPLFPPGSNGKSSITGYVKTHHVRLLPEAEARSLPELPAGYRTTLFRTNADRYSCYLRLTRRESHHAPMSGIVRLEFSGALPLDRARVLADRLAHELPRFAGVAHIDPRAPQNLQPIGALEQRLRRLLGDAGLAERAVRDAVLRLHG